MKRGRFLTALSGTSLAAAALQVDASAAPDAVPATFPGALVLSGGGARGAYEAGVIGGLVAMRGVSDGQMLAPYGVVCGTSIGALNGWFVATGQYARLKDLWYGISAEEIIRLKPQFAAVGDDQSGVLERLAAAIRLVTLVRNQSAVLQSQPVLDWITQNVDPERPLLMPLIWAVTNLTTQRPEYFYLTAQTPRANINTTLIDALRITLGPNTIVRQATHDLLHRALFASAAIPLAFDPVELPNVDGNTNAYVDGGIASNSPVAIAHALSNAADIIMMDPPFEPEPDYEDAVAVAFGVYGTMQRKILEVEMRDVYFQSIATQALSRLTTLEHAHLTGNHPHLATFMNAIPSTDLRFIRPTATLPLAVAGFDDEVNIGKAYRTGWLDVTTRGFSPYSFDTFEL
jgi:predicted acylesterase/phospholipase RssA